MWVKAMHICIGQDARDGKYEHLQYAYDGLENVHHGFETDNVKTTLNSWYTTN